MLKKAWESDRGNESVDFVGHVMDARFLFRSNRVGGLMLRRLKDLLVQLYVVVWQVLRVCSGLLLFSCAAVEVGACHSALSRKQVYHAPDQRLSYDDVSWVSVRRWCSPEMHDSRVAVKPSSYSSC